MLNIHGADLHKQVQTGGHKVLHISDFFAFELNLLPSSRML